MPHQFNLLHLNVIAAAIELDLRLTEGQTLDEEFATRERLERSSQAMLHKVFPRAVVRVIDSEDAAQSKVRIIEVFLDDPGNLEPARQISDWIYNGFSNAKQDAEVFRK